MTITPQWKIHKETEPRPDGTEFRWEWSVGTHSTWGYARTWSDAALEIAQTASAVADMLQALDRLRVTLKHQDAARL
jgi:hypothetical protein